MIKLTINTQAILSNYNYLKSRAKNCGAVVKADMYGLRAYSALKTLSAANCRAFFVATAQEAISIRPYIADTADVFILNTDAATQAGIPVVNCLQQAANLERIYALSVDIGMNRWGISPDDIRDIDLNKLADGCLIISQFSEAEVLDSAVTASQIKRYRQCIQVIQSRLPRGKSIRTSLANSAGIFVPNADSDVPRPGYALYGGNPTPWTENPMQAVVTLQAPIAQVRYQKTGEPVGYGSRWVAPKDCWLATLGLGYADGWLRSSSGHGLVRFRENLVPIVGQVSMDSIVVNCGDIQPEQGECVTLMDDSPELSIDSVAERAGTIGYEVLTSLGNRYNRRYV